MITDEEILQHGRQVCRVLHKLQDGTWRMSKRIKGSHQRDVVIREIIQRKITRIREAYLNKGAGINNHSKNSKSIYLYMGTEQIRISDHNQYGFEGTQVIVGFDTDILELINSIK